MGQEEANVLVPKVNGGVALHKSFGLMDDTCSTANRVAELMCQLREEKARAYHGEEEWSAADDCEKVVFQPLPSILSLTYTGGLTLNLTFFLTLILRPYSISCLGTIPATLWSTASMGSMRHF